MDQARILIHACVDVHPEIPVVALLGLMHFWIELPVFVLGGAGSHNQGRTHDLSMADRHATCTERDIGNLKDLLAQLVLLH